MFLLYGLCQVIGAFLCVSYGPNLFQNWGNIVFVAVLVESVVVILFVGTLCGLVNKTSAVLISKLKMYKIIAGRRRMLWRKRLKACHPLKIRFSSNFIDILTPLGTTGLCIKGTVRLLLLR